MPANANYDATAVRRIAKILIVFTEVSLVGLVVAGTIGRGLESRLPLHKAEQPGWDGKPPN